MSQTNESATVAKSKIFVKLNKASLSCFRQLSCTAHTVYCLHSTLHLLLSPSSPSLLPPSGRKNARAHLLPTHPTTPQGRERDKGHAELTGGGGGELEKKEQGPSMARPAALLLFLLVLSAFQAGELPRCSAAAAAAAGTYLQIRILPVLSQVDSCFCLRFSACSPAPSRS